MTPLLIVFSADSASHDAGRTDSDESTVSNDDGSIDVRSDDGQVEIVVDNQCHSLSPTAAATLREAIGDALSTAEEFLRTGYERRPDGRYAVTRRDGEPAKVFESVGAVHDLYRSLPTEFDAEAVGRAGITGSRRHLLVRHFAEHPAFDCQLTCRNPLTAEKRDG